MLCVSNCAQFCLLVPKPTMLTSLRSIFGTLRQGLEDAQPKVRLAALRGYSVLAEYLDSPPAVEMFCSNLPKLAALGNPLAFLPPLGRPDLPKRLNAMTLGRMMMSSLLCRPSVLSWSWTLTRSAWPSAAFSKLPWIWRKMRATMIQSVKCVPILCLFAFSFILSLVFRFFS